MPVPRIMEAVWAAAHSPPKEVSARHRMKTDVRLKDEPHSMVMPLVTSRLAARRRQKVEPPRGSIRKSSVKTANIIMYAPTFAMESRALETEKSRASENGIFFERNGTVPGGDACARTFPAGWRKLIITGDRVRIPRTGSFSRSSFKFCITRKLSMNMGLVLLQKARR